MGWIKFNPTNGGVTIASNGSFDGYARGESIGWIHFKGDSYNVASGGTAYLPWLPDSDGDCDGDCDRDVW